MNYITDYKPRYKIKLQLGLYHSLIASSFPASQKVYPIGKEEKEKEKTKE